MQNALLTCSEWAQHHLGSVDLGDCRLVRRLVKVAAALAACPRGTLPAAFPTWSELKAAYRLLDNPSLTFEKALAPHWKEVRAACAKPGEFLLIEDTTLLDFSSHRSLKGIGRIGDDGGRGFNLHTTLAFQIQTATDLPGAAPALRLLGLAGQHRWVRAQEFTRGQNVRCGYESKKRKFSRARESERWGQVLSKFPAVAPGNQRIYIADRESDMYELFDRCEKAGCHFVVRACQDRALLETQDRLFTTVEQGAELGRYTVELRARPGVPARTATVALRSARVTLRPPYRPGGKPIARQLNVVHARELNGPEGRAVEWFVLTDLECENYEQARRVIQLYACRWIIEEYHKALKTGAGIEKSQLEERRRVESLLAVLSLVAVRLLDLKLEAAQSPSQPIRPGEIPEETLTILEARLGKPSGGWTKHNLWIWIARLGGYPARNGDGPPGWQTLWRGSTRLREMTEGAQIIRGRCG